MQLPNVVLLWRLSAIREVILSGFQLELFSLEEKPVAYLYATQVLDTHLDCLDNLLRVVPKGTLQTGHTYIPPSYSYNRFYSMPGDGIPSSAAYCSSGDDHSGICGTFC
jgi:hypothetical protein